MTLTEEQRAALKRVAAYMDEMYSVASPYHGCTEDSDLLRAMIDSSGTVDYDGLRCESCGKTLKEIRGSKYAGDYCMGEIRLDPGQEASRSDPPIEPSYYFWCDECKIDSSEHVTEPTKMIGFDLEKARAADEALPYPLDANEIWVSGKGQMHINPPNAPSIFFTLSDLCEFRNLFHGQAAEIERLRASLIDLHAEYINTLEKNPECSAWDLDEQSDADQRRLRRNAAHAISITEPLIYLQADQQAAHIQELEDALVNERAWRICHIPQDRVGHWPRYEPMLQDEARQQLQAEGKIGNSEHFTDASKMIWHITEERKAAIWHAVAVLKENDPDDEHLWDEEIAVLRAMLTEAE